jgi:uncharacterized protein (TIGR03437 family)
MAPGAGSFTITNGLGLSFTTPIQIGTVAPGVFAADATGSGLAAAVVLRVHADGTTSNSLVANCTAAGCTAIPIDLGIPTDQVFLSLYGTGIRGRSGLAGVTVTIGGSSAQVLYAGAQPTYPGLDQINVALSPSLAGGGDLTVATTVDGQKANAVKINVK